MLNYIIRRLLYMLILIAVLTVVSFVIIQLPPGDFLTMMIYQLERMNVENAEELVEGLRSNYGLDLPVYAQYFKWISNIIFRGDFGRSFTYNMPVAKLVGDRMLLTMALSRHVSACARVCTIRKHDPHLA